MFFLLALTTNEPMNTYYHRPSRAIFTSHIPREVMLETLANVTTRHDGTTPDDEERACMLRWARVILDGTVPAIDVAKYPDGRQEIRNGECRLSMARELGVETLPVRVHRFAVRVQVLGYRMTPSGLRALQVSAPRPLTTRERQAMVKDAKGTRVQTVEQVSVHGDHK